MAENEKEEKAEKKTEENVEKKKSPVMLIIILIVTALIVGGGGTVAFLMFRGNAEDEMDKDKDKAEEEAETEVKPGTLGPIVMLEPFVVNLSGSGGRNYLKLEIGLELSNEEVREEINNKIPQIKDAVLMLLSSKTYDDVKTADGKLMLKESILIRLNSFLNLGSINNIYFTNFVVQ